MKVAILAGGRGLRLAPETNLIPKPMVEIGGYPMLWHIMKHYSSYGFSDFVFALGYRGDAIKRYISEYRLLSGNLHVDFSNGDVNTSERRDVNWRVDLIETGPNAGTGTRLQRIAPFLGRGTFLLTYGDGVADVDLEQLLAFHRQHGRLATLTAVRPPSRFGQVRFSDIHKDQVAAFSEKPQMDEGWINGGFFVLERGVLDYIDDGEDSSFERCALERLADRGELVAYRHDSFWQCMDTARDRDMLQRLWAAGNPPWKVW